MNQSIHIPVLVDEVIKGLNLHAGDNVIDATVGGGGHAEKILHTTAPNGRLLGIDLDPDAITRTRERLHSFGGRAILKKGNYTDIKKFFYESNFHSVSAVLLDLGLSSDQLKSEFRGFGIQTQSELDMRFSDQGLTAREIVNTWPEKALEQLFSEYGEERRAARVAKHIITTRKHAPINTTRDLADVVVRGVGSRGSARIHPATRVFQALRIATNRELENIASVLPEAISLLAPGGRLVVITFHSLEDRIVKQYFKEAEKREHPLLKRINKKVIKPSWDEVKENKAARSAKLRIVEKF
jgi:16S rRNA (cytosine1402-N4)-methyltransferase